MVSTLPVKSPGPAGVVPLCVALPVTVQFTVVMPLMSWVACAFRCTANLNGFAPALPSLRVAIRALMASVASSSRIVPMAEAVPKVAPPVGPESVTRNSLFGSGSTSPATLMVMTLLVSCAAKLSVP